MAVYDKEKPDTLPSDDDLRRITGINDDPEGLKEREQNPSADDLDREFGNDFSDEERDRINNLNDEMGGNPRSGDENGNAAAGAAGSTGTGGWQTNLKDSDNKGGPGKPKASLWFRIKTARKLWLGGGGAMFIVSLVFAMFAFISPYKADHVVKSIESRVGGVAEHALEQRLLYYMTRYLILQAAIKHDTSFEKERAFTYIGNGVFKTLYTNWKGANLEAMIEKEYNLRLRPNRAVGSLTGRELVRPQNWTLEFLDSKGRVTGSIQLDSKAARQEIADFAERSTQSHQVYQRYKMRKVLKRYYGINNWKPFEKTQNKVRDKYLEKKAAFKKFMVRQTVGRMSTKYAAYMSCLIDGGDACKDEHLNPPDQSQGADDPDMDKAIDGGDNDTSEVLTKKLQQIALKRMIAASAAGLGILQVIGGIQKSVDTGALSKVTYDSLSQQYSGYGTAVRSASDQVRSGHDFDGEDARLLAEMFNGFESSPVYNSVLPSGATVVGAASQYVRDCDGDGSKETTLDPGETVCPNKKLIQNREGIKKMFFWPVIDAVGSLFNSTLGKPLEWASNLLNSTLEALGTTALMSKVLEISGLSGLAGPILEAGINWVVGFSVTGTEIGEAAYDATYAAIFVTESSTGTTLGGSREQTLGGGPLTNKQVSAIMADRYEERQFALSKMSIMERYLSPDVQTSFTSYAIMHAPTNITNLSSSFLQSINPVSIIGKFGSLLTTRTYAAAGDATLNNPFGGVYTGYANDHPALNMEEDDLNATYQCDLPVDERPQNKRMGRPDGIPFDVYTDPDPCLLNEATGQVGGKYFDGSFNDIDS